MLAKRFHSDIF
uniref:Uncharacterized protein n=1 Tax=Rhizophora mucronata TaxID=61149 RepID=A0A2P2Q0G5_RHIMU